MIEFKPFDKIARLNREVVVTEKLDGTNAQIFIDLVPLAMPFNGEIATQVEGLTGKYVMFAGSRTKWITPEQDNYGFARWAQTNATELFKLGVGQHFGEWWGSGIQRRYGLTGSDKRFSLFNTGRWIDSRLTRQPEFVLPEKMEVAPACCHVVPVLGTFPLMAGGCVDECLTVLRNLGSAAAPGFMDPEGIVIYHTAAKQLFKLTLKNDEKWKGNSGNAG